MADYVRKINGTLLAASEVVPNSPLATKLASLVSGAFEVVSLNQSGKPNVANPSTKIIYLTKDSSSSDTDPYTEWIYTGTDGEAAVSSKWEIIGETTVNLSGYVNSLTQSGSGYVSDVTKSGNSITVTKTALPTASTSTAGIIKIGTTSNDAAAGNHTHTTTLAPDSGTSTVTLAHGSKYKLTAGGTSVVFTMPTDTKVKATAKTDDANYNILATATPTSGNATEAVYGTEITLNPSTNTIAANISGDAATASAAKSGSTLETQINNKIDAIQAGDSGNVVTTNGQGGISDSLLSLNALALKADSADSGKIAIIASDGGYTGSAKTVNDFATSAQGTKADSAIQGVKLNGAASALTPDSGKIVTIPNAIATGATGATNGLMTADDKKKLNGIATGAEVNQNAFSNVKVGSTTVAADAETDTLELATTSGKHITLTADATNDKITIDTDLEHKSASSSGTDVSLVTTGEMYNWNAKYTKPGTGIPKSDLASAVQTSLGKADSSVQGVTMDGSSIVDSTTKVAAIPKATTPTGTSAGVTGALGVVTLEIVSI